MFKYSLIIVILLLNDQFIVKTICRSTNSNTVNKIDNFDTKQYFKKDYLSKSSSFIPITTSTTSPPSKQSASVPSTSLTSTTSITNDFNFLYKLYKKCSINNLSLCLKLKLATSLENALRSIKDLQLFEGVKFIKDNGSDDKKKNDQDSSSDTEKKSFVSENDIINTLPRSMEDKESALTSLIFNKILSFFQSHTLQVKIPASKELERSLSEESRKKKKDKGGAFIMIPLLLAGTFIPIAYGALAFLAGKALIVSKLALVLASIIGIKKLFSSTGHHESSHEVVVSGGHSGGSSGWARDLDLAYNGYKNLAK